MDLIRNALAELAAAKARVTELVEPEKMLAERVEACVHAIAQDFEKLYARVAQLEQHFVARPDPAPAQPDAGTGAVASTTADEASSPAEAPEAPVPAAQP